MGRARYTHLSWVPLLCLDNKHSDSCCGLHIAEITMGMTICQRHATFRRHDLVNEQLGLGSRHPTTPHECTFQRRHRMRIKVLFVVLVLCLASTARAQNVEIFGGYSYMGNNNGTGYVQTSVNGWNAAVTANYKSWGVVAGFSGHQYNASASAPTPVAGSGGSGTMFLFGPQYSFRRVPRVTPFVHALFGEVQGSIISSVTPALCSVQGPCQGGGSSISPETVFAMALGGGLDVKVNKHVWVRLIQVDYVRQNFSQNDSSNGAVNAPRISAGVVFTFGKR